MNSPLPLVFAKVTFLVGLAGLLALPLPAQNVTTVPEGYITMNITAGIGTTKVRTLLSLPLIEDANISGAKIGRITSLTSNTITSSGAGWTSGNLSQTNNPNVIRITSGNATGLTLLISNTVANTAETLTIDAGDASYVNLTSLGITTGANGDTFQILSCDTLAEAFGTPGTTGILGGSSAAVADTVVLNSALGAPQTFYYNTTVGNTTITGASGNTTTEPGRWTRQTIGNPDATNTPIRPDSGLAYFRLGNSPLTLVVSGRVPSVARKALLKNSGVTYFAHSWPTSITLNQTGFQQTPGWLTGGNAVVSDTVTIGTSNYFHDGSNWRRQTVGSPISNNATIEAGQSVIINKRGTTPGASITSQAMPYNLNN